MADATEVILPCPCCECIDSAVTDGSLCAPCEDTITKVSGELWAQAAAELRATTNPADIEAVIERFERRSRGEEC